MKTLTLTNDNAEWIQIIYNPPSEYIENLIQKDPSVLTQEEALAIKEFNYQTIVKASTKDAKIAQALYDKHKVPGTDLIAVDITLPDQTGIINCRQGQEHIQVRF